MKENIIKQIEINNNIKKLKISVSICSMNISGSVIISVLITNIVSKYNYNDKLLPLYITSISIVSLFTLGNVLLISNKEKLLDKLNEEIYNLQNEVEYQKRYTKK